MTARYVGHLAPAELVGAMQTRIWAAPPGSYEAPARVSTTAAEELPSTVRPSISAWDRASG